MVERLMKRLLLAILISTIFSGNAWSEDSLFGSLKGAIFGDADSETTTSTAITDILSSTDITAGLKEALRVGTDRVITQIGVDNGFNNDPEIHIPLPSGLQKVQSTLKKFGFSSLADDVELKLNRAAEKAAPQTKALILDAINNMTLEDAKKIYQGPENAATQYFKKVASDDLSNIIKPIVDQSLDEVGAIAAYDGMIVQYSSIPFVPDVKAELSSHAVKMTLQGLFYYLAKEEAAIRQDPTKRTTDLLVEVFGQ